MRPNHSVKHKFREMFSNKVSVKFVLLVIWVTVALTETLKSRLSPTYGGSPSPPIFKDENRTDDDAPIDHNYRLPNNTEPIHYEVELTTNVDSGDKQFTGQVNISLIIKDDTNSVVLHARDLKVLEATIKSADLTPSIKESLSTSYDESREFLNLTLQDALLPRGSNWILSITFKGKLRTDGIGFHILSHTDEFNQPHYLATTNFESTNARQAFPCFDEPAKRATFRVTINHSPFYNALSNMPINKTVTRPGVTVFDKSNVTIPTYLVAFHVSDFVYSEDVNNSVHYRVYSKPGTIGDQKFGLETGMRILQRLADYFKVDYQLPQMIQIALPGEENSIGNWGLVTHSERNLLYNGETSTAKKETSIVLNICHAFSQQWLGNYVSIKWWSYLWLTKGFAALFSYKIADEIYPEWDVYQLMHKKYQFALDFDGAGVTSRLTDYVETPEEISYHQKFFYNAKAASVLSMWQHALGDEVFRLALNKYLTKNAFSATEETELFEALQRAIDEKNIAIPAPIGEMFPTWSQQSGYPILTIRRNYESNSFTVRQKAFHQYKTTLNNTFYVPFNYAYQSKSDFSNTTASHYLLNLRATTIIDKELKTDDWLILNKQSTGYYCINYDEQNWGLIANGLLQNSSSIHTHNRAQLLYDAFSLVEIRHLNQSILLNLLTYLSGEDQYAPWATAFRIFTNYKALLNGDTNYDKFKEFIVSLVSNIYEKLGVNDIDGEPLLNKFTRSIAVYLACEAGLTSCLVDTKNKLKTIISVKGGVANGKHVESYILCNGLRRSSDKEFKYCFQQLMNSKDPNYRRTLITALGCSENEEQLKTFVESSIDLGNELTPAERLTILESAFSRSSLGLLVSIEFLHSNWEAYEKLSSSMKGIYPLSEHIFDMGSYVNNDMQKQKIMGLVNKVKNSSHVQSYVEPGVKATIKANFQWLKRYRKPLMSWLRNYRKGSKSVPN